MRVSKDLLQIQYSVTFWGGGDGIECKFKFSDGPTLVRVVLTLEDRIRIPNDFDELE